VKEEDTGAKSGEKGTHQNIGKKGKNPAEGGRGSSMQRGKAI